jgi:tetratricopeptide (TPR) repeat protein
MNKLATVVFVAALSLNVHGQQSKVVSAYNSLKMYYQDKTDIEVLKNAKTFIDEASANESTSGKPKTWYYKGNVYWAMNDSKNPIFTENGQNPLLVAVESYRKAYELDPKYEFAIECFGKAQAGYRSLGIEAFNKNDFNAALSMFEETTALSAKNGIVDTNSIENSSIAAMKGKNVDKAQEYLTKLIGFGKEKDGTRYASLYRIFLQKGDTTTAMKVLADARLAFPNDQRLLTEELNNYLSRGKAAEAEKLLAIAIEKDPTNHLLPYAAGTVYEDLGKREEAIAAYKKAIELKADYWEAYFNLGALYNNSGKALIDKANAEKDTKKYDAINKLAEVEFNLALPNLEKALELAPADSQDVVPLLKTLKQIYSRLNMTDKYNEVKKRLEP